MSIAAEWIRSRLPSAPPELLEAMLGALPDDDRLEVPDALVHAAVSLYHQVVRGSGGREDALPLLAADALFTHAFQARAETAPDRIAEFAATWSGRDRLAQIAV